MTEVMREQFEAWARTYCLHIGRDSDGYYSGMETQAPWVAWQAALRSPAVVALVEAAKAAQWDCHGKCPVCAGFMVGPNGETRHAHTDSCPVGIALAQYATLAGESHE